MDVQPTTPRRAAPRLLAVGLLVLIALGAGCRSAARCDVHPLRDNTNPGTRKSDDQTRDLLYVPNRLVDLAEWVRFNASIGPGLGFDIRITRWVGVALMGYYDAGLGWEGRRRAAYRFGPHFRAGVGPWHYETGNRNRWCRPDFELSIEAHLFGSLRVAIDFAEIVDFFAGIFGFDPLHDDFDYR